MKYTNSTYLVTAFATKNPKYSAAIMVETLVINFFALNSFCNFFKICLIPIRVRTLFRYNMVLKSRRKYYADPFRKTL